jgi:hypothetical protein
MCVAALNILFLDLIYRHPTNATKIKEFIQRCFSKKNGGTEAIYLVIGRDKCYLVKSHSKFNNEYKQGEIIQIDNICVMFGGRVFQWVRIVIRYSPICFYMIMRQTSFNGLSRIKIEN